MLLCMQKTVSTGFICQRMNGRKCSCHQKCASIHYSIILKPLSDVSTFTMETLQILFSSFFVILIVISKHF
jgi:hypothetical protein